MSTARERKSVVGYLLTLVIGLILAIIGSVVLSIVIEWMGIFFEWWEQPGAEHAKMMLEKELGWLNSDFKEAMVTPVVIAKIFMHFAYYYLVQMTGLEWLVYKLQESVLYPYALSAIYTIELAAARLAVIVLSLPAMILFGVFALVDGLVERDLRTWGGGRETSFVYHHARSWITLFIYTPITLYLSSPWSIHPSIFVLMFAIPFGYTIWLSATYFKKYL
ncbi:MAG: TIGR03747 family integrating conjugative element membrane protein [Methyloprofundus sp.]|nr:TIGR03747 family integrating conjugative element membrane protein [Methyloprofundus sp.]